MATRRASTFVDWALALLGFVAGFVRDFSEDFHWHLVLGRYTLEHHALMRSDVLSHTFAGRPQHLDYWLADVAFALAYRWFAYVGCYALRGIALAALLVLLAREARRLGVGPWAAALGPALWLGELVFRCYLRPETFTFPLLAALLAVLGAHERSRDRRWLWASLPVLLVWANVHGSVGIGLAVVGCYAAEGVLRAAFAQPRDVRALRALLLLPPLAFVVSALNPEGLREPLMFLRVTDADPTFNAGIEWRPLALASMSPFFPWLLVLIVATLFGALLYARQVSIWRSLAFLLLLVVAVRHGRFIKAALIVAVPLVASNLTFLRQRFLTPARRTRFARATFAVLLTFTAAASFLLFRYRALGRELGTSLAPGAYPEAACRFAREHALPGHMLNAFDFGSFLLFCLPEQRVYIDQRAATLYTPEFSREYRRLPQDVTLLERRVREHGVGFAFLGYDPIAQELAQFPLDWPLVYFDDLAQIYVRAELATPATPPAFTWLNPRYVASLAALENEPRASARAELARQRARCATCGVTALLSAALDPPAQIERTLATLPDDFAQRPDALLLHGVALLAANELPRALDAFNTALQRGSDPVGAAVWIDRTLARAGRNDQRQILRAAVQAALPENRAQALALRELTRPLSE